MKPIIGVIPLVDEKKESLWMLPGYFRGIEAVEMPDKDFVWAVQWHPEFSYQRDKNSLRIFEEFVRKCT